MELQQLKYFKTVAAIGKISDAAEALFVSAPALSTSISRLEKELGVRLFDRTNNRIVLNPQGQIFLKYVNQVFAALDHAKDELQQSKFQQGPHISILSVNTAMWVNLITAFTSEFPQYTLSCTSTSIPKLSEEGLPSHHSFLLAHESDVPPNYTDEMDSIFLFQASLAVMLHKDHPLAEKTELDIRMLAGEKIFMSNPGYSLSARLLQLFDLYGLPFPSENSYSFLARQKMVAENIGISFGANYPGHAHYPDIKYVPLADPFGPWTARLYWRKDRSLTDHESAFRNFTKDFFQSLH